MKQEIHGNTEGIRRTLLEQMKALYQLEMDADAFLPPELSRALAVFTSLMNREIAVYITRDGEIVDVMIGTHQDVELRDYRLRRNSKRLSCVRCIHTHPNASGCLSDVDISALRAFRYDAMTAIAVRDGKPGLVQTAFLGEKVHGENQVLLLDPLRYDRIPQGQWMERIGEADAAVLRGEDACEREKAERAVLMGIESEDSLVLEPMASYISYQVTVTEVLEEFIQTTTDVNDADNYENTINYVPGEDTLVFDAQGNQLSLGDVKAGDLLTVYTGAYTPAPMIMPPQYQAEIIIIEDPEAESPVFTCADTFVADEEGMLVGLGNTLALNMSEDVEVVDREGQACEAELENMDLLVFYDVSTKSIPAQTTPLKVVLLGQNEQALSNMNAQ